MKKEIIISELDKNFLEIIRKDVTNFISSCSKKYDTKGKVLLDIAPQDYEGAKEFFSKSKIKTLDIDPNSKADIIADICDKNNKLITDSYFDFVLCTEVLEHTLNPLAAVEEIYRILKPGGKVFISTPFNFRIHGPLPDCWRFTEHGLRYLLRNFKIIVLDQIETKERDLMPIHYTVIAEKE